MIDCAERLVETTTANLKGLREISTFEAKKLADAQKALAEGRAPPQRDTVVELDIMMKKMALR